MADQEPFFITQSSKLMTPDERREWFQTCTREAKDQGCTFARFSIWPPEGEPELTLFEGWKEQPENQGEPRFHHSKSDQKT